MLRKMADGTAVPNDKMQLPGVDEQGWTDHPLDEDVPDLEVLDQMEAPPEAEASLARYKTAHAERVRRERQHLTMYRVAAGMAAVFLLYFSFAKFGGQFFHERVPAFVTVEVPLGSIKQVVLPDSSLATVSPGSVLRYPKNFGKGERKVHLDKGEAFFEVAKNPEKPFRVASGELQTTALGTSFTVQYDPVARREKINLYTGKVSVEATTENPNVSAVVLTPGKAYEYRAGKVILSDFTANQGNPVAKGLVFDEVPFAEAIYRIGAWHGISVELEIKDLKYKKISGNFNNKGIEDILSILSFTYQFQFAKTDSLTYKIRRDTYR